MLTKAYHWSLSQFNTVFFSKIHFNVILNYSCPGLPSGSFPRNVFTKMLHNLNVLSCPCMLHDWHIHLFTVISPFLGSNILLFITFVLVIDVFKMLGSCYDQWRASQSQWSRMQEAGRKTAVWRKHDCRAGVLQQEEQDVNTPKHHKLQLLK